MLTPRVRRFLEFLDPQFVQGGEPACATLEAALSKARGRGDDAQAANLAVQLGVRLLATATVARSVAGKADVANTIPSGDDVLEPAIELLSESLTAARRAGDPGVAAFAQSRLADAYYQSNQFAKARAEFADVAQRCVMPRDSWLYFDATQKIGDCAIELEDDADALIWYQRAMDAAREIDDPFEIHMQHGKIASALSNLKHYDEALHHLHEARDLLVRITRTLNSKPRSSSIVTVSTLQRFQRCWITSISG
jgi:tetratricopeptide (TPR) repeat protein